MSNIIMPQPSGYRIDLEDKEYLLSTAVDATYFMRGEMPDQMDPRNSELADRGFLQVEMQGGVGACQGVSLTDCGEFAYTFATGEVIQFDWMHAYIESQKEDNIRRDMGSTLSGGTKAAKRGFTPEKNGGKYPADYPGWNYSTPAMNEAAKEYPLLSHTTIEEAAQICDYIGSGNGIVQVGMPWGPAMQPDAKGCIREWYTTRDDGGHAWVFVGYVPDVVVGARSKAGRWLLAKNSWSIRWGLRGYFYLDFPAVDKFLAHPHTSCFGRSDMQTPRARKIKFDFTKKSILG